MKNPSRAVDPAAHTTAPMRPERLIPAALLFATLAAACSSGRRDAGEQRSEPTCVGAAWRGEGPIVLTHLGGAEAYIPGPAPGERFADDTLFTICTTAMRVPGDDPFVVPIGDPFDYKAEDFAEGGIRISSQSIVTLPFDMDAFRAAGGDTERVELRRSTGGGQFAATVFDLTVEGSPTGGRVSFPVSIFFTPSEESTVFQVVYRR